MSHPKVGDIYVSNYKTDDPWFITQFEIKILGVKGDWVKYCYTSSCHSLSDWTMSKEKLDDWILKNDITWIDDSVTSSIKIGNNTESTKSPITIDHLHVSTNTTLFTSTTEQTREERNTMIKTGLNMTDWVIIVALILVLSRISLRSIFSHCQLFMKHFKVSMKKTREDWEEAKKELNQ